MVKNGQNHRIGGNRNLPQTVLSWLALHSHIAPNHNLPQGPYTYLLITVLFGTDMFCIVCTSKKQANSSLCPLQNGKVPGRYLNTFPFAKQSASPLFIRTPRRFRRDLIYIFPKEKSMSQAMCN